jgi:hypothetical protein
MPAFGLNRYTQAYAVAVNNAGTRIHDRTISCVDMLAADFYGAPASQDSGVNSSERIGDLKTNFQFIYPFVGNTAVSNSFNLADPSLYRITWNSAATIVHNVNGWTTDTTNGSNADTGCRDNPITATSYNIMWGIYCRTANAVAGGDLIGLYSSAPTSTLVYTYLRNTDGRTYYWWGSNVASPPSTSVNVATPNSQGFFSAFRQPPPGYYYCYRNGANITYGSVPVGVVAPSVPTTTNWILAWNGMGRNYAFPYVSTPTPGNFMPYSHAFQATIYNIIQRFQTRLGRAV